MFGQSLICLPPLPPVLGIHQIMSIVEDSTLNRRQHVALWPSILWTFLLASTNHAVGVLDIIERGVLVDFYVITLGVLVIFLSIFPKQTGNYPRGALYQVF